MSEEREHALTVVEPFSPDMVRIRMENDQIFALAQARPRDPIQIVAQLQQLIDAYPAAADDAIYSKPVGTVMRITCKCGLQYETQIKWVNRKPVADPEPCPNCGEWAPKAQDTVKKFAEGLSIRAAESIRSIYGYTRLATTTQELEDGKVKLTGAIVDYAAGNVTSDERIVSPFYKARNGQMTRTPEDRFLNVIVKAEKAKLRRDVILDNTPNIVKAMFKDACEKKLLGGLVAPEVIAQKVLPAFAQYGISAEQLDQIIGRPQALGWREEERLELRKILSALKHGETTATELLAGLNQGDGADEQPAANGATMEDLIQPSPPTAAPEAPVTFPEPEAAKPAASTPAATSGPSAATPAVPPADQQSTLIPPPDNVPHDFAWFTQVIQESPTVEEVESFEAEAKGCLSEADFARLAVTAANRKITLKNWPGRKSGGPPRTKPR